MLPAAGSGHRRPTCTGTAVQTWKTIPLNYNIITNNNNNNYNNNVDDIEALFLSQFNLFSEFGILLSVQTIQTKPFKLSCLVTLWIITAIKKLKKNHVVFQVLPKQSMEFPGEY